MDVTTVERVKQRRRGEGDEIILKRGENRPITPTHTHSSLLKTPMMIEISQSSCNSEHPWVRRYDDDPGSGQDLPEVRC